MMPLMYAIIKNSRDIEEASRRIDEGKRETEDYEIKYWAVREHNTHQKRLLEEHFERTIIRKEYKFNTEYRNSEELTNLSRRLKNDDLGIIERRVRCQLDREESRENSTSTSLEENTEPINFKSSSGIFRPFERDTQKPKMTESPLLNPLIFSSYPHYDQFYSRHLITQLLHFPTKKQ